MATLLRTKKCEWAQFFLVKNVIRRYTLKYKKLVICLQGAETLQYFKLRNART